MLAEDVYKIHQNRIHRIAKNVRKYVSISIPQEKVLDENGNIDILFTGSHTTAPSIFEKLNQITYELRGIHTHCRIIPQGNDIKIICSEINKEDVIALKKCLEPIREHVSKEISNFGIEMLEHKNKTSEELDALLTPLSDIVEYFYQYKKEHCPKQVEIKYSEITIKGNIENKKFLSKVWLEDI